MVQIGSPEEYFGVPQQEVVVAKPVEAKITEPVEVRYVQSQNGIVPNGIIPQTDYTPLIIGVCFLGTICFLAFLAWTWKK